MKFTKFVERHFERTSRRHPERSEGSPAAWWRSLAALGMTLRFFGMTLRFFGMTLCLFSLTACTQLDDYLLGKDNTPVPDVLPSVKNQVTFKQLWTFPLGGKIASPHDHLTPVVHGNVIYVAVSSGQVQARQLKTGELRWTQNITSGLASGPVVGEGVVIFGTRASSLVALNQHDGHVIWEKKLSGEALAKPVISSGRVFVKTIDGTVFAFSIKDGKRVWRMQHGAPELILKESSSPVMGSNHLLVVGFPDGKLVALDAQSGQILWEKSIVFSTGASDVERLVDIDADPIFYKRMILIGTYQGFVGALSLETGEFSWQKPFSVYKDMELGAGQLYVSDDSDVVWSLDPNNGQVYWKQVQLKVRGLTSPVWTKNGILVGDRMGLLHVLSTRDGALMGRTTLKGAVVGTPVVVGNQVIVLTQTGDLFAFRMVSGGRE
ncbi:MAG: outer membrane protein assembly factor BamB [Gammaproteobacteria bacterium]|nr:outer membrane protein assembly factor BamB [Gammaproteobacteria bacterium]